MCTNLKELRREAYKLWGLTGNRIIYDFPRRTGQRGNEFFFMFDYSEENASWPRIYAMAAGGKEPAVRIIAPIIVIRRYDSFQTSNAAWYDMPVAMHQQILELVETQVVRRELPLWKRALNIGLPKRWKFSGKVPMESYVFGAIMHNGEAVVRAL